MIEKRLRVLFQRVAVDQSDIETGAPHVRCDDFVVSQLIAQKTAATSPATGPELTTDTARRLISAARAAPPVEVTTCTGCASPSAASPVSRSRMYFSVTGPMYALTTVVTARSNSPMRGAISCDRLTGIRGAI